MPELPDLEVFSRNLNKKLSGKKLIRLNVFKGARLNASKAALKKSLENQKLLKVYREGKELRLRFQNKNLLGLHLMLRGKLTWFGNKNTHKFTLLELYFGNDLNIALTDYQANARITLNPNETVVPDALSNEVNEKFWKEKLRSRATIKNLLLDQHVVRGIGNAYADEILWKAGISPFSVSNKIPVPGIKKIAKSVKEVSREAIAKINKAEPGIIGGEIRDFLAIHNARRKQSPSGARIKQKISGGRKTYFTS